MAANLTTLFDEAPVRRLHAEMANMVQWNGQNLGVNDHSLVGQSQTLATGRAMARRSIMGSAEGQGYQDMWYFSDELAVLIANRSLIADTIYNYVGEGLMKLHFRIAGNANLQFPDEDKATQISGPFCGMMVHPAGLPKLETCLPSGDDRWITVLCKPSLFSNIFGLDTTDLPRQLAPFARDGDLSLLRAHVPLKPEMVETVLSLIKLDPMNPLSPVWAEAKVMDLVCGALSAMEMLTENQICRTSLTPREIRQIEEAAQILADQMSHQVSLKELARLVGLNRNKLNTGFKQHFGMTVGDYLLGIRMRRARELLEARDMQVTQVAFEVGYEFPSNFATSFKRYYGYSPKLARKGPL